MIVPCKVLKHLPLLGLDIGLVDDGEVLGHLEEFLIEVLKQFLLKFADLVN